MFLLYLLISFPKGLFLQFLDLIRSLCWIVFSFLRLIFYAFLYLLLLCVISNLIGLCWGISCLSKMSWLLNFIFLTIRNENNSREVCLLFGLGIYELFLTWYIAFFIHCFYFLSRWKIKSFFLSSVVDERSQDVSF